MENLHYLNETKIDTEKQERYNLNNLFDNESSNIKQKDEKLNKNAKMVKYKESFFSKIINKIKNTIHFF